MAREQSESFYISKEAPITSTEIMPLYPSNSVLTTEAVQWQKVRFSSCAPFSWSSQPFVATARDLAIQMCRIRVSVNAYEDLTVLQKTWVPGSLGQATGQQGSTTHWSVTAAVYRAASNKDTLLTKYSAELCD